MSESNSQLEQRVVYYAPAAEASQQCMSDLLPLYEHLLPELDRFRDTLLRHGNDEELLVTDKLFRVVAAGKQGVSPDVVTVYRAWEPSQDKRDTCTAVYAVVFSVIALDHEVGVTYAPLEHSWIGRESENRKALGETDWCLEYQDSFVLPAASTSPEICYERILILDRNDTVYRSPLLVKQQHDLQNSLLNTVIYPVLGQLPPSTIPVPCFPAGEFGIVQPNQKAQVILVGEFGGNTNTISEKLDGLKNSTATPFGYGLLTKTIKDMAFELVDDSLFQYSDIHISKTWRMNRNLAVGWEDRLKIIYSHGKDFLDDVKYDDRIETYGQLVRKAEESGSGW